MAAVGTATRIAGRVEEGAARSEVQQAVFDALVGTLTPDEQQLMLEHAVTDAEAAILADLGSAKNGLLAAVVALGEHCDENNLDCTAFLGDVFGRLLNAVRTVRDHNLVPVAIPLVHDAGTEG